MVNRGLLTSSRRELAQALPLPARQLILQILSAIAAFFFAQAGAFGSYAPFGVAYISAVPDGYVLLSALGAAAGYIAGQQGALPLRYIAAVIGVAVIRRFFTGLKGRASIELLQGGAAMLCTLGTGLAVAAAGSGGFSGALMYASEAVLAGGAAFFMGRFFAVADGSRGLRSLNRQELSCLVIVGCLMLLALSTWQLFGVSPGRILMCLCVLSAARFGREVAGSIIGVAMGVTVSITGDATAAAGSFAFGGLLAGVFSSVGNIGCAAAFLVSSALNVVLSQGAPASVRGFYEALIACAVFALLPSGLMRRVEGYIFTPGEPLSTGSMRESVVSRLDFAAGAMNEVAHSVEEVSEKLKKIGAHDFDGLYRQVQDGVCKKCGLKMYCWDKNFEGTSSVFNDINLVLREKEIVEEQDVPKYFRERCIKLPPLLERFNLSYADYLLRESAEARVAEVRSVVADQFSGMADMLSDLAHEMDSDEEYDGKTAARVACVMKAFDIEAESIICRLDKYGRMTVEVTCGALQSRLDRAELKRVLDEACDRIFDTPCVSIAGGETKITVCERASLRVERGAYQLACRSASICGDAYECFNDGRGREIMIISDGMGSGGRAAVDGAMAAGLLSRLCRAGFGFDCALRVVNSALLVKSGDETLATLDIACTDLFTGKTEFLKAGAPASFIRKKGKAGFVEQNSLPAGILRRVEFGKTSLALGEGDIILLVSDGVINGSSDWIKAELECWKNGTAAELAEHIANEARRRRVDGREDDITVVVSILKKGA